MTDKLNSMSTGSQESDGIDLGRLIGEVIDHKGLIISVTFFFMGLGFIYAFLAPPVYEADSLVQVEQNAGNNFYRAFLTFFQQHRLNQQLKLN